MDGAEISTIMWMCCITINLKKIDDELTVFLKVKQKNWSEKISTIIAGDAAVGSMVEELLLQCWFWCKWRWSIGDRNHHDVVM